MSNWEQQPGPDPYGPEVSFPPLPSLPGQEQGYGPQPGYGPPPPGYGPPPAYGAPGYGPPHIPPPPRRGPGAGLWIGLGVGAFVLLLVVGCVGSIVLFQDAADDAGSPDAATTTANDPGEYGAGGPPPPGGISTPPPAAGVAVGQPAKLQNLEFTVTAKPTCGATVPDATPRQGQFCLLPVKIVNRGSAAVRWSTPYVSLYVSQRDYHSPSLSCARSAGLETSKSVDPGGSWEFQACYDVPTGQNPVRVRFTEQNRGDEAFVDLA